ncbi:MAG: response regulator [Holophagaceae bacterium]|nr:response regulator [Holophagaceae bacterium]
MPKGPLSPRLRSLLWALFSLGLIHLLDRNTPAYITLNVLYTIPVMIAAWGMGRSGAFGLALLATGSWIYVSFLVTGPFTSSTSLTWVSLTLFAGFITPGIIVDLLKRRIESERELRLSKAATEDKLLESNELLSLFVHHSPIYAYIKEVDSGQSRVLHASENFQQMVGIPGSELVGKTMAELFPPAMAEKITADDLAVVSGGKGLERQEDFDGRSYLTHKYPIVHGGKTLLAGFTIDITERKQAEADKAELDAWNHQLQKARSLGVMAGSIAHHFNNKLQSVIGYLEILPQLTNDEDPGKFVALAKEAAEKAAEVSRLLLIYLGNDSAPREPRDLSEICLEHVPFLQKGLPSQVTLDPDCPSPGPVVSANVDQLQRVLANLVGNASEAMTPAGGWIRISLRTCPSGSIPTSHRFPIDWKPKEPSYACLEVADNGCGIGEEDVEKVFDPFFSTRFIGRGLGLPVALGIVQAHGGSITVESSQGHHSVFRVYLPLSTEPAISLPEGVAHAPEHEGDGTLLLVDDDDMLIQSTGALLGRLGFTVLTARDGVEALEVFRQHRGEIRCVITDLTMPRLDGWGLLSALRQLDPDLPVILASGYDKGQVLAGTRPDQPQAFLSKPFDLRQLREALDLALVTSSRA